MISDGITDHVNHLKLKFNYSNNQSKDNANKIKNFPQSDVQFKSESNYIGSYQVNLKKNCACFVHKKAIEQKIVISLKLLNLVDTSWLVLVSV